MVASSLFCKKVVWVLVVSWWLGGRGGRIMRRPQAMAVLVSSSWIQSQRTQPVCLYCPFVLVGGVQAQTKKESTRGGEGGLEEAHRSCRRTG